MHSCIQRQNKVRSFVFSQVLFFFLSIIRAGWKVNSDEDRSAFCFGQKRSTFFFVCFFFKVNAGLLLLWKNCGIKMTHDGGGGDFNRARTSVLLQICLLFFPPRQQFSSVSSFSLIWRGSQRAGDKKNGSRSSPSPTRSSTLTWTL